MESRHCRRQSHRRFYSFWDFIPDAIFDAGCTYSDEANAILNITPIVDLEKI
jgi:hypothetical protein